MSRLPYRLRERESPDVDADDRTEDHHKNGNDPHGDKRVFQVVFQFKIGHTEQQEGGGVNRAAHDGDVFANGLQMPMASALMP